MTTLQIAVFGGVLVGLGLTLVIARLMPAHPDLKSAFERLDPAPGATLADNLQVEELTDRVGVWIQRRGPVSLTGRIPHKELALLRRPVHRHLGEKALWAMVGLMFPPVFTFITSLAGLRLGFALPIALSLVLAVVFFHVPDFTIKAEARKSKREFVRALAAYIELVALEIASGTGTTQSLEAASEIANSWVFTRVQEELARARWSGQPPWDGLKDLADQLDVSDIADLAEIMRLSSSESASVAGQLRARAASMRSALLNEDLSKANAAGEQMTMPVSMLALVFLALLGTPAVLRIAAGG